MKNLIICGIVAINCILFSACTIETSTDSFTENTTNQNNAEQQENRDNLFNNNNNFNNNNANNHTSLKNPTNSQNQLVNSIFEQAKLGKIYLEFRYGIGSTPQEILKYYGQPDAGDPSIMDYMKSRFVSFVIMNNQVTQVISNHPKFLQLTEQQIIDQLGPPQNKGYQDGTGQYIMYQAGSYQLLFFLNNSNVSYVAVKSP